MKNVSMVKYVMKPVIAGLLSLSAVFLMAAGAEAALTCYQCHGNGTNDAHPTDATTGTFRNITTGAVKGNHNTHFGTTSTGQNVCTKCHGAQTNTYASNHAKTNNWQIQMLGVTYSKGTSFAQTTNSASLGYCSNVNCHFQNMVNVNTPVWGSTVYSSTANCSSCHNAPPTALVGHAKHGLYSSALNGTSQFKYSTLAGCVKCHPDYATGLKFSHATSVTHPSPQVTMSLAEGTYNGARTNFLPSQSASRVLGSCSTTYCHSPGTLSTGAYPSPKVMPTWGVALTCGGCHDTATTATTLTSRHLKHVGGTANYSIGCVDCHSATVTNSTTIKNVAYHVNKFTDVSFQNRSAAVNGQYNGQAASSPSVSSRVASALPATAYCNNVYCHSQGRSSNDYASATYKGMSTANWSVALPTGSRACSYCHGGDSTNNPIQRQITSSGHRRHIGGLVNSRYAFTCDACHNTTATSNTTVNVASGTHVNYQKDVSINTNIYGATATYAVASKVPGTATGNCNNLYCHSSGQSTSPVTAAVATTWSKGALACTACHGDAATSASLSTPHTAHVNNAAIGDIGNNFGCVECHAKTVSNNVTISASGYSNHVNQFKDYSGVNAGGSASYVLATKACNNTYCHTSGKKGKLPALAESATRTWSAGVSLGCNACHGASTGTAPNVSVAGEPNYLSGKQGSYSANNHYKHVTATGTRVTCNKCHASTVDGSGNIIANGKHLDRFINVSSTNFKYTAATRSCGTFIAGCHASSTPVWGGAPLGCDGCHPRTGLSGAHTRHTGTYRGTPVASTLVAYTNMTANSTSGGDTAGTGISTFGSYGFGCSVCHPLDGSTSHANGTVNVLVYEAGAGTMKGKSTSGTKTGTGTSTVCSNVYCHSNGKGVYYNSPTWGSTGTQTSSTRCAVCHGFNGTTGAHSLHVVGIHYNSIANNSMQTGLMAAAFTTGQAGHGDASQATTISCNICHSLTTTASRNKYNSACNNAACHGNATGNNADVTGAMYITNLQHHVDGNIDVQFINSQIRTKAQLRSAFTNSWSNYTGNAVTNGWQRSAGGYKAGTTSYDISRAALSAGSWNGTSCSNVVCHAGHQNSAPVWTNMPNSCSTCHNEL